MKSISIVTINFNNAKGLAQTIESVVCQTFNEYEFIIIDGGSSDNSVDVIKKYSARIDYWVSESDSGVYNAMNKGVAHANGEYCIFMNSGDCFVDNNVLNDVVKLGLSSDVVTGGIVFGPKNIFYAPETVSLMHFFTKSLAHQASFIRTSLLKEFPYDESLKIVSDWKFFLEVLVLNKHSYSSINRLIGVMEEGGIGTNTDISDYEHNLVLRQILPECAIEDYRLFINGKSDYDRFYMALKESRLSRFIYVLNCLILKLLTCYKKDSWLRKYKLFPDDFYHNFKV